MNNQGKAVSSSKEPKARGTPWSSVKHANLSYLAQQGRILGN